jgi:hypothetical protein
MNARAHCKRNEAREGWPSLQRNANATLPLLLPADYRFFDYPSPIPPPLYACLFPTLTSLNHSASASLETIPRAHCLDRSLLVLSPSPHTRPAVCGPVCGPSSTHTYISSPSPRRQSPPDYCGSHPGTAHPYSSQHIPLPQTPHRTANTWTTNTTRSVYPSPSTHLPFVARSYLQGGRSSICMSMIRVCLASFKLTTHPQRPTSAPVVSCRTFSCFLPPSRCLISPSSRI